MVYGAHEVVRTAVVLTLKVSSYAIPAVAMPPATKVTTSPPAPPFAQKLTWVAPAGTSSPGMVPQLPVGNCQWTPPTPAPRTPACT